MATTPTTNRFFEWIRGLSLDRQPGWLGGVCSGLAARIGIDPVIVRGIAVVIAVLGGPMVLLYAVAWLLLPARDGSIHLQNLLRGTLDRAVPGIVALFILALLPLTQGFWYLGSAFWSDPYGYGSLGAAIGRAIWTLVLISVGIWFVIWLARRRDTWGGSSGAAAESAAADSAAADSAAAPNPSSGSAASFVSDAAGVATDTLPGAAAAVSADRSTPPPAPVFDAATDDLAEWKQRQAEWKQRFDVWKHEQAAVTREQRLARVADARERANSNATERNERVRQRRAANPRLRFGFVAIALGAALLAGGIAALSSEGTNWNGASITVGFAVATIVIGVTMIIAGAFRRRVGFLGFVVAILTIVTIATAFLPTNRAMLWDAANIKFGPDARYTQLFGSTNIGYNELNGAAANGGEIDLWQAAGSIYINVPEDTTVRLEAQIVSGHAYINNRIEEANGDVTYEQNPLASTSQTADNDRIYSRSFGTGTQHYVTVRIWQASGNIVVDDQTTVNKKAETK